MTRNTLKNIALAAVALTSLATQNVVAQSLAKQPSKRELVLTVLDQSHANDYVPAAFFLHFDDKLGAKAVQRHVEFFKATNMDIVKIQYEIKLPALDIKSPKDWSKVPVYDAAFFEPQLSVIEDLARQLQDEALILPTVYSPVALLHQVAGDKFVELVKKDPKAAEP